MSLHSKRRDVCVHPDAKISNGATVYRGATIEAGAVIGDGATIGANAHIETGAIIKPNAGIGFSTRIKAGAIIETGAKIGNFSVVQAGVVVPAWAEIEEGSRITHETRIEVGQGHYPWTLHNAQFRYGCVLMPLKLWTAEKQAELCERHVMPSYRAEVAAELAALVARLQGGAL